ncbi:MAG TPA: hypothetical protein VMU22_15780 [Rhizomicrobium sp.]|nr:hypothetical protein [Rhizomicrobium sp.]
MNKLVLLTSSALVALCASFPALADSATITQTNETFGNASQHQPGAIVGFQTGDSATILQQSGIGDTALQEQARFADGSDFAVNGIQSISQANNNTAFAAQQDNSVFGGDNQSITQTNSAGTQASQTNNDEFTGNNVQASSQDQDSGSSVTQINGINLTNGASGGQNSQTAMQNGQTNSSISQTLDGASSFNTQVATQNYFGGGNTISALVENGDNNHFTQTQDSGASNDTETASFNLSSGNVITQYQGVNSSGNMQSYTNVQSSGGAGMQIQANGTTNSTQTITQIGFGGDYANQAGQGQAGNGNTETISQTAGFGNNAIQNQGLNFGQPGYVYLNGGALAHF